MAQFNSLTLKGLNESVHFSEIDSDKEICISVDNGDFTFYITMNEANSIITHLANQLKSVNEPVELLTTQTP